MPTRQCLRVRDGSRRPVQEDSKLSRGWRRATGLGEGGRLCGSCPLGHLERFEQADEFGSPG